MSARGRVGLLCLSAAFMAFGAASACGSSDDAPAAPPFAGQGPGLPQPPRTGPPAPPDLVSRLPADIGNATTIADVGEPTEGPAWRDRDGALYFTVPGSPNPLRRVVPGGAVETVDYGSGVDGGYRFIGLATGGADRIYATDGQGLVTLDVDDAGAVVVTNRALGPPGVLFGDITTTSSAADRVLFVDHASTRTFTSLEDGGIAHLYTANSTGHASAVAFRGGMFSITWVAMSGTKRGDNGLVAFGPGAEMFGGGPADPDAGRARELTIPANGIALGQTGLFVAYAEGIAIWQQGSSFTQLAVPIAARPTCLTFGGADRKTLFVTTTAGKIYSLPVTSPGIAR